MHLCYFLMVGALCALALAAGKNPVAEQCYTRLIWANGKQTQKNICIFFTAQVTHSGSAPFDFLVFGSGGGVTSLVSAPPDEKRLEKIRRDAQEVLFNKELDLLLVEGTDLGLIQAGYVALDEFGVPLVDKLRILGKLVFWYASR